MGDEGCRIRRAVNDRRSKLAQVARQSGMGARQLEPRAASGRNTVAVPKLSATLTTTAHPHAQAWEDASQGHRDPDPSHVDAHQDTRLQLLEQYSAARSANRSRPYRRSHQLHDPSFASHPTFSTGSANFHVYQIFATASAGAEDQEVSTGRRQPPAPFARVPAFFRAF